VLPETFTFTCLVHGRGDSWQITQTISYCIPTLCITQYSSTGRGALVENLERSILTGLGGKHRTTGMDCLVASAAHISSIFGARKRESAGWIQPVVLPVVLTYYQRAIDANTVRLFRLQLYRARHRSAMSTRGKNVGYFVFVRDVSEPSRTWCRCTLIASEIAGWAARWSIDDRSFCHQAHLTVIIITYYMSLLLGDCSDSLPLLSSRRLLRFFAESN